MKRWHSLVIIIAVSLIGFLLGRATGDKPMASQDAGGASATDYPMPAVPPHGDTSPAPTVPAADRSLVLETPAEGAALPTTFDVAGRARDGGRPIEITVLDTKGATLAFVTAPIADVAAGFGRFATRIVLPQATKGTGSVRVAWKSLDGKLPDETVTRKISFGVAQKVTIKVFFPRTSIDGFNDCSLTAALERAVPEKSAVYRTAIDELLKGPTTQEKADGFFTSIPDGARLRSVAVDSKGKATADFFSSLEKGVAGSCRVTGIRAQITATLLQFPEVRSVVISVDGRVDDVLQP